MSELSEQARSVAVGPPRQGFFYGWVIVWAGFVLLMLSAGITYSTPVLFRYFEADFGIGRGQAAFIFSFSQLTAFVIGPVAGSLAEKHGPRLAVGGGVALLGLRTVRCVLCAVLSVARHLLSGSPPASAAVRSTCRCSG